MAGKIKTQDLDSAEALFLEACKSNMQELGRLLHTTVVHNPIKLSGATALALTPESLNGLVNIDENLGKHVKTQRERKMLLCYYYGSIIKGIESNILPKMVNPYALPRRKSIELNMPYEDLHGVDTDIRSDKTKLGYIVLKNDLFPALGTVLCLSFEGRLAEEPSKSGRMIVESVCFMYGGFMYAIPHSIFFPTIKPISKGRGRDFTLAPEVGLGSILGAVDYGHMGSLQTMLAVSFPKDFRGLKENDARGDIYIILKDATIAVDSQHTVCRVIEWQCFGETIKNEISFRIQDSVVRTLRAIAEFSPIYDGRYLEALSALKDDHEHKVKAITILMSIDAAHKNVIEVGCDFLEFLSSIRDMMPDSILNRGSFKSELFMWNHVVKEVDSQDTQILRSVMDPLKAAAERAAEDNSDQPFLTVMKPHMIDFPKGVVIVYGKAGRGKSHLVSKLTESVFRYQEIEGGFTRMDTLLPSLIMGLQFNSCVALDSVRVRMVQAGGSALPGGIQSGFIGEVMCLHKLALSLHSTLLLVVNPGMSANKFDDTEFYQNLKGFCSGIIMVDYLKAKEEIKFSFVQQNDTSRKDFYMTLVDKE